MADVPNAYDSYRDTPRFGALDGLRAFAAAAVVWHHASDAETSYFGRGVGVTTFFVISGFLITRLLLRERERCGTISLKGFWLRRALRIFPLYYAVLCAYVVLVAHFERGTPSGATFWASLPYYASFTTNWFVACPPGERVIFYFAWSLAVQEQFYLFWPVVLRFTRLRYASVIPFALLLAADLGGWANQTGYLQHGRVFQALTSIDTPIFFGVLAAFVLQSERGFPIVHRLAGQAWSFPVAVVLVLLPRWIPDVPRDLFRLCITFLVIACVLAPGRAARVFDNPVARHVGNVSFGIYLMHMLMLNAVRKALPGHGPLLVFALGIPLVVLAASASHRWFERPFLRLRDSRLAPRSLERPATVSPGLG